MSHGMHTTLDLSTRELEVLASIADGNTNAEIGKRLIISTETVKSHVKHILEKLGARDRAVAMAIRDGLIN